MYRSRIAFALAMAALAAILLPSFLTAQITFERTYGGADCDWGFSAQQTSDGGYVISGSTKSFGAGDRDVWLLRTDSLGDTLWARTYGGAGYDDGWSVQQTLDGGYITAGDATSFGHGEDVYLIKTDADGGTKWTRTLGGDSNDGAYFVQQTTDTGYVVAGYTYSSGMGGGDVWVIKTNAIGDTLWTRTWGDTGVDAAMSVQQTADGGYIIAGYTTRPARGYDVLLIKTDAAGDTSWTKTFGGDLSDIGYSVRQTTDLGYIVVGYTWSFGRGEVNIYLIKTTAEGDTVWTRTMGDTLWAYGFSVQQTADGGYIVAGDDFASLNGGFDCYLAKIGPDGDSVWTRTFGGSTNQNVDQGYSAQQTRDGGYVVAGSTESYGAGVYDVYLIKTDSLGNVAVEEPKASPTRAQELSVSCEPNPFAGTTTVRLSPFALCHSPLTLRVYDAGGHLAWSQPIRTSSFIFHPSSLASGTYFLRLDAAGEHATTRIVLQR